MQTIEERAKEWTYKYPMTPDGYLTESDMRAVATNSYIQGATEQKAIDEELRLSECNALTREECDREAAFAEWYLENGKGTPTYSDAIEWARKEVINKACEWLDTYLMEIADLYDCRANLLLSRVTKRLRKAMEE